MNPTLFLVVAIAVLAFVLWTSRERFQPEFLDKSQVQKTVASEDSHYSQVTNHMSPSPVQMGPMSGMASPFQVNQYKAYIQ
jgi:FtsZ-interacting cell division protein ZipA